MAQFKQTSLERAHWMNSYYNNYYNTVSFAQCFDNASQRGKNLFIFMFMKISVEKVKYKKVKLL